MLQQLDCSLAVTIDLCSSSDPKVTEQCLQPQSLTACAAAMYSASDVHTATVGCNLLLQCEHKSSGGPPSLRIAGKVRVTRGFHSSAAFPKQNASLQGACYVAQHSLCCCPGAPCWALPCVWPKSPRLVISLALCKLTSTANCLLAHYICRLPCPSSVACTSLMDVLMGALLALPSIMPYLLTSSVARRS